MNRKPNTRKRKNPRPSGRGGSQQQDGRARVSDTPDVCGTMMAHMGTGGNNVPMVMSGIPSVHPKAM